MSKVNTGVYKNIDRTKRARIIRELTNNGRNRKLVRDLQLLMSQQDTLLILNALWDSLGY